ncbi:FAD-binding protein [uncultured Adlercreutzia sp.]|uniref:FAD-binding protein n=1 Tax=uncultured Adlercreutzia sp. TaxID=875803 RepID=UPI0025F91246|nr:FAD-binding protein [uncultured Adlercreutzia sp.]
MTEQTPNVSRRSFLRGAALAGAGMAAAGMIAGCAPEQKSDMASTGADTAAEGASASGNPAWLGDAPVVNEDEVTSTIDTELLVIGGGESGVCAARRAAELGMKVVVMEKQPEDTWAPIGCDVGTINSQTYLNTGAEAVDEMQVLNEWQLRSYCRTMPSVAKMYATRSGEVYDWVCELAPQEELDEFQVFYSFPNGRNKVAVNHSGYTSFPGTVSHRDFNDTLGNGANQPAWGPIMRYSIEKSQELGAEWLFGTSAIVLIQDEEGGVTGAYGENSDGIVRVNAEAVLLACGDFSGNGEMVLALNDEVRELAESSDIDTSDPSSFMGMGQDGMGHKLACWAGGVMEPGPRAAMNFGNGMGAPALESIGNYPVFGGDGKRFYNDAQLQFGGLGFFARRPRGERCCTIADGKWEENIMNQGYEHNMSSTTCAREWDLVKQDLANYTTGPDGFEVYGFTGYGMNKGRMYAAETLDELADILGYEGEAKQGLLDEIAHYNEMCAAGKDTDWGRDADLMNPIDTPPFFGISGQGDKGRVSSGMVQMSGVLVTDNHEVRRVDDSIIKGLYACGNTAGGRYAIQYHTLLAGNSVGLAITQGYCAGEHIAQNLQADKAAADEYSQLLAELAEARANAPVAGPPM